MRRLTCDEFVRKANAVFNSVYDYSKFVYVNNSTKGIIICPYHGEFLQRPQNHMNGQGCAGCSNNKKMDTAAFIEKANYIHENKYDYSQAHYINSATKVKIVCPVHGMFQQKPNNHISSGQGCPKCKESKGEKLIRGWLTKNKLQFDSQYTLFGCKNERTLLFDFAIFDKERLVGLIEYNGEYHYQEVDYGNTEKAKENFIKVRRRDQIKAEYCKEHNIPLLIVSYDEVTKLNDFLKEFTAKHL